MKHKSKRFLTFYQQHGRTCVLSLVGLLLAGSLFSYRLGSLVPGLSSAELKTVQTTYGWHGIGQQPLNLPINVVRSLVFMLNPSHSPYASRLPSIIFGLIAVAAVTALAWQWHGRRTALLTGALFCASAWTLHISRLATNDVLYLAAVPTLLLASLLSSRHPRKLGWYGLVLLAGLLLYIPGMIWLILVTTYLERKRIKLGWQTYRLWWQRGLYILAGVVWLPGLIYRLTQSANFKTWLGLPAQLPSITQLGRQFIFVPIHLFIRGPFDTTRWLGRAPVLDAFTLAMVLVGAYFYIRHYKASRSRILALYFLIGWILVALNGSNGPVGLSFLIPLLYLVAATGITYILHDWLRVFPINPVARGIGNGLIIVAVVASCTYNLAAYFVAWPHDTTTESSFHYRP